MALTIEQFSRSLVSLAPLKLAESWDNVGLLVGDRKASVQRVMVCLTITPAVVAEAVSRQVDLVISHHPLPFKPLPRLTRDTIAGGMLLDLIQARVAVYSSHTAWDSASGGVNRQLADLLCLDSVVPLVPFESPADDATEPLGAGRCGRFVEPVTVRELAARIGEATASSRVRFVGNPEHRVAKVAFACGSGGSFLDAAARVGCDAMVTGEATFHTCLDAESRGIGLVMLGHYASERFAMESMAAQLAGLHPDLTIWPSENEADPIRQL
ncbi:Putative GTP cyclohydrolase 1 type 2 [Roseimaritima multifibrata]|uniref:GTP cyclohydrolase 1 type 2 homolog n=1 Tax=Roseimaritima multifibrata TaxID=1930274 RepID=A0A517MA11_9BACT|nr:Nif3-like dinuclear metal center hexameric protein [Roseimaritima multifibrata]QDS91627.1 Putative GTP cyclohydrolase 1 type 2 [Roseimaritima multifibrata]